MALATVIARLSHLAVGAAYGPNEALLIVPGLLVPYVLFIGWSFARREGPKPRAMKSDLVLFAIGVHVGTGLATANPSGVLLAGFLLVDPSVLLAAAGLYWARRVEVRTIIIGAVVAIVAAFLLVVIYHLVLAFIAGAAVGYLERAPGRRWLTAGALAVVTAIVAIVPFIASPATPSFA